jgi:hypothetical protein
MSVVLRIEGEPLDLESEAVIALSKQVAAIGQFQTRLSSFTNKFNLPTTAKNKTLLIGSDEVYTERPASLWYNGVEVASNSRLIIDEVSDRISVTLRPGNSGFFDIIKTLKLRDFDLSDFDHVWNRAYIVANRNNIWSDGVCYPVIDTGNQSAAFQVVLTKGLIGGMFMKYLINRIASFYGYTMVFPTDTLMDELFYPISNQQVGERISDDVKWRVEKDTQTFVPFDLFQALQLGTNLYYFDFLPSSNWSDKWSQYDVLNILGNGTFKIIRLPFRGVYIGKISFDIVLQGTQQLNILIRSNLASLTVGGIFLGTATSTGTYTFDFEFDLEAYQETNLNQLTYALIWLEFLPTELLSLDAITVNNLVFQCTENDLPETNYNRPISMQHNLPDITVGQLFIEFGNITGSYFDVNDIEGTINVVRLNDVFDGKANPYEWQPKIDTAKQQVIRYSIPGFGKQNVFRWSDDSEKNYIVECDNELLPDTVDLIKSGFNSINDRVWQNASLLTAYFNVWDADNQRLKMDGQKRVMRVLSTSIIATFFQDNLNTGSINGFNIGVFRELDWLTLYNTRYEPIIGGIIDRMLYVEIFFTIDELDLIDFGFERPIYLQDPNGYFYVQRISEFTGRDESTKFIMIKI